MRVGLVVTGGIDRSGAEVIPAFLWLIERLAPRHEVHVFVLHHQAAPCVYPLLGATVHDLGTRLVRRGRRRRVQRARLRRSLRALPPFDVLHAWWGIPAGWVATSIPPAERPPVVVTASSGEFVADRALGYGFQRRWIDRRLIAQTMRRAAVVTVATRHMAALAARLNVSTRIVAHGVPGGHITEAPRSPGPPWRLVHIGHLNRVKDQTTLLHAIARLIAGGTHLHLDLAGGDSLGGDIQRLAVALGIDRHVTFHGVLPHDHVRALLRDAHLHVMASRHEAGGVAVLDAAAAGVPTVGTNVGYIADWAPDAATAVPVGDVEALADAIAGVLAQPARRAALGAAARANAAAHTADDMAAAFERVYHAIAVPSRTPGSAIA